MAHVHVVGTGAIGAPVIRLLAERGDALGVDRLTFARRTCKPEEQPLIQALLDAGAEAAPPKASVDTFVAAGFPVVGAHEEILVRADVVVEATPDGVALENMAQYRAMRGPKLFVAQGSEEGFGLPFALGVNDDALTKLQDRFVQVVSCNTHAMSAVLRALVVRTGWGLKRGRFVCIRRTTDVGQKGKGEPAPSVDSHDEPEGTHHAHDVTRLFRTAGVDLNLTSSALKVPTQFMHTLHFNLEFDRGVTQEAVGEALEADPLLATTMKRDVNTVFNTGREFGYHGRILAQAVVSLPTLFVRDAEVSGFAFTPQDGNVILSNVASVARAVDPQNWRERIGPYYGLVQRRV